MGDYVLSCCTPADMPAEYFERRNIPVICFHIELGGQAYLDDMGKSVPYDELFRRMDAGESTRTSQVAIGEYAEFWKPFLDAGKDVIHVSLSSGISGTYQSAMIARNDILSIYPDRKVYVVDSMAASSGFGMLVDAMADRRDEGMEIDTLYQWAEKNKLRVNHWFYSTDLTYYIRGGRVSKAAGIVGQALNICPLLNVDNLGRLAPREKIRTKKKVMLRTFEIMKQKVDDRLDYAGKCFISHSLFEEEAKKLAAMIEEAFPKLDGKVMVNPIGATIGCHTGPGTIALFFWGDERED